MLPRIQRPVTELERMSNRHSQAAERISLGDTIARLRKQRGLTQGELAGRLAIHQSMVTRWEKGQAQPRTYNLEKLAQALEVSIEELLVGDVGQVNASLRIVDDPEFIQLFGQLDQLDQRDRDALKAVIEAMLTRARVEAALHPRSA